MRSTTAGSEGALPSMKEDYQRQVEKLTALVDSGVDPVDFITASEESLKADLDTAKVLTKAGSDPQVGVRREGRERGGGEGRGEGGEGGGGGGRGCERQRRLEDITGEGGKVKKLNTYLQGVQKQTKRV